MTIASQPQPPAPQPWLCHTAVIQSITPEVSGVATYHLAFRDPEAARGYRFEPGQFNMLYLPGAGEVPISLSADPSEREVWAHTIRVAGNVTRVLSRLGAGGSLGLRGPFGSSWPINECGGRDVILVAGGIGLAPLRPVIYALLADRQRFGRLTLLYGARSPDTLLYEAEFAEWSRRGLLVQTTVDRSAPGWLGNVGVVSLLLDRMRLSSPRDSILFACGPEVMMKYTVRSARQKGLAESQIWVSLERNMQCAIGQCGHCQLGPAFVCRDGPVFRQDRIAPYLSVEGL